MVGGWVGEVGEGRVRKEGEGGKEVEGRKGKKGGREGSIHCLLNQLMALARRLLSF